MSEPSLRREVEPPIPRVWRESYGRFRRLRTWFWLNLALFPVLSILGLGVTALFRIPTTFAILAVAAVFIPSFYYFGFGMAFWRCPRCHKLFHSTWWFSNPLSQRCLHCGLPKRDLR